jgi:hypothetical protein
MLPELLAPADQSHMIGALSKVLHCRGYNAAHVLLPWGCQAAKLRRREATWRKQGPDWRAEGAPYRALHGEQKVSET